MTDQVVGKTTLRVGADVSEASTKLKSLANDGKKAADDIGQAGKRAAGGVNSIGDAADKASQRLDQANARWIRGAETLAATYGKPKSALLEYQAAQRGISPAVYEPIIAKLRETESATTGLGMSAKATAAAMRGVPAQFTDIMVSLQGGQNPLTVFLQQGGQLKDMFGGIGPAARALGGYVAGLVGPFTLAAAAAAALGFAYYQGSTEGEKYNRALITTGNYAGVTAGQMQSMARSISEVQGTQGAAAEALTALAAGARVGGNDLQRFAAVALSANKTIGQSIEDTGKIFAKLADDPVKASIELNRSMGYLTGATYDQIRAAEEMGRKDEAGAIAQRAYATAMEKRMAEVRSQAGTVERAWDGITGAAKRAWDAMLNIGRPRAVEDIRKEATKIQDEINAILANPGGMATTAGGAAVGGGGGRQNAALDALRERLKVLQPAIIKADEEERKATADGADRARNQAVIDAKGRLDAQKKATQSRAEQRAEELAQFKRDAALAGIVGKEYNDRVAAINEKYKDKAGPKPKAYTDNAAERLLLQLKEQEASAREQLTTAGKLGQAASQQAKFEQQIADLKEKKILTADQKSLLAAQDQIRAQLAQNVAIEQQVTAKEKAEAAAQKAEKERLAALERYNERYGQIQATIASSQQAREEQYQRQLDAYGQGDKAYARQQETRALYQEYLRYQRELDRATPTDQLGGDAYRARTENIKAQLQAALQAQQQYYSGVDAMQSDWSTGSRRAFANYLDTVRNVSGAAESLLGGAFKSAEDAFTKFVTTGKLTFGDLINTMVSGIARLAVQQNITGPLFSFLSTALSGFMGPTATPTGLVNGNTTTLGNGGTGYGLTLPRREHGGPVAARQMYEVNERGIPELLETGGRQYLMMAGNDGNVTPLVARTAAGASQQGGTPAVNIVVEDHNGNQFEGSATTGDDGSLLVKMVVKQAVDAVAGQFDAGQGSVYRAAKGRFGLRDNFGT
ncbi:phage tail tape measure protein [Pigmentiphaga litoralis]|uniref:phage tail tape measure protein n=1 Tax=Pigmentiphaga litoralis TaxID=516702 RepID=UPI00167547DC|nr:phage tail tape measure protein [Pigmentiphaga litoralis]GGX11128.1 phage tail tape measure protein [Pigmentiphaga litoralis]